MSRLTLVRINVKRRTFIIDADGKEIETSCFYTHFVESFRCQSYSGRTPIEMAKLCHPDLLELEDNGYEYWEQKCTFQIIDDPDSSFIKEDDCYQDDCGNVLHL